MAASYWSSTQYRNWTFSRQAVTESRGQLEDDCRDIAQLYPLPDRRLLSIFISQQLAKLGKPLNVRQQTLATAQAYVRRYYTRIDPRRTNLYLIMATALYVASKIEESPQHIRSIAAEASNQWQDVWKFDTAQVGECEFSLISAMRSQLIIHHPYRSLKQIAAALDLAPDDASRAWSVVNDSYATDLLLLHAPHVIATAAIVLALVLKSSNFASAARAPATATATATATPLQAAGPAHSLPSLIAPLHSSTFFAPGGAPAPAASSPTLSAALAHTALGRIGQLQELLDYLADSNIEMDALVDCIQEFISLYEVWEQYSEATCREQLSRQIRFQGLERL